MSGEIVLSQHGDDDDEDDDDDDDDSLSFHSKLFENHNTFKKKKKQTSISWQNSNLAVTHLYHGNKSATLRMSAKHRRILMNLIKKVNIISFYLLPGLQQVRKDPKNTNCIR